MLVNVEKEVEINLFGVIGFKVQKGSTQTREVEDLKAKTMPSVSGKTPKKKNLKGSNKVSNKATERGCLEQLVLESTQIQGRKPRKKICPTLSALHVMRKLNPLLLEPRPLHLQRSSRNPRKN